MYMYTYLHLLTHRVKGALSHHATKALAKQNHAMCVSQKTVQATIGNSKDKSSRNSSEKLSTKKKNLLRNMIHN